MPSATSAPSSRPSPRTERTPPSRAQPAAQAVAGPAGPGGGVLSLHDGERGPGASGSEWLTPEGAGVVARPEGGRHFGAGPARPDGDAVAERLGHGDHIRLDPLVLEAEPSAGAGQPGLDLVHHEQDVVLRADAAQGAEVVRRRLDHACLAEDRLHQHAGHLPLADRRFHSSGVVVRHVDEPLGERHERFVLGRLARGVQGGERPTVEGVPGAHHDVAAGPRPLAGELQGALVGLGPRVGEEHLAARRRAATADQAVDGARQLGRHDVAEQVRHVQEGAGLLGQGVRHHGVGVAEGRHRQAREEVEIAPTLGVPQPRPGTSHEGDGRVGIGVHQGTAVDGGSGHGATWYSPARVVVVRSSPTMVPTPSSVKISSSMAWATRPSSTWARCTPPLTARAHASALGAMPPLAAPEAIIASRSSATRCAARSRDRRDRRAPRARR